MTINHKFLPLHHVGEAGIDRRTVLEAIGATVLSMVSQPIFAERIGLGIGGILFVYSVLQLFARFVGFGIDRQREGKCLRAVLSLALLHAVVRLLDFLLPSDPCLRNALLPS